ncbi:MAG: L-tyrosine/L-tryptophan isonitrile synthase family protein [Candidatus Parcubacteria bacterium]|nr:L-tyrosine/L-tryptophan isonitrile synthase family protein [Candidatus Parcubacteria bacterium]
MHSNKFVYPSLQFKNLNHNHKRYQVVGKSFIDFKNIKLLVEKFPQPKVVFYGRNIEEKILNLFLSDQIIFGSKKYIKQDYKNWIKKIQYFTKRQESLQFSILGFPFKVPMPLKTNRILPDMGEILGLSRLVAIVRLIRKIYPPSAQITIFTEESFAKFAGLSKFEAIQYQVHLIKLIKKLNYEKELKVVSLSRMEKLKEFKNLYVDLLSKNKKKLEKKEPKIIKAYKEAGPPIEKIINSRKYGNALLQDVFNLKLKNTSKYVFEIRKNIQNMAKKAFVQYFSYIEVKNQLDFITKVMGFNLPLTVSPKKGRLGVIPVDKHIKILPYHGVTIYSPLKNKFDIIYLVDLENSLLKTRAIFLKGDKDSKPFYYELMK